MVAKEEARKRSKRKESSGEASMSGRESSTDLVVTAVEERDEALTTAGRPHTSLEELAASNLVITAKARVELVQNQLIQFIEILSIKLRNEITRCKHQADMLRQQLTHGSSYASSATFPGEHGAASALGTAAAGVDAAGLGLASRPASVNVLSTFVSAGGSLSAVVGKAATTVFALGFSYSVLKHAKKLKVLAYLGLGLAVYNKIQLQRHQRVLNTFLNVVRAFGNENGEDDLTQEKTIRNLAKLIGIRHINQVSRLSKNGQNILAIVVVNRISKHLSRHSQEFEWESRVWLKSEIQHFQVWLQSTYDSFVKPADRLKTPQKLSLNERCIRALTSEAGFYLEDTPLERELYLSTEEAEENKWTSSGVLGRSGICVRTENSFEYFLHEGSDVELYGFCYGTREEAMKRGMRPISAKEHANPLDSKL